MLSTLLASSLFLAGRVAAQTCAITGGMTQSGSNNYVVDTFSDTLLFSYAVNQCTGISLLDSTIAVKYTCEQDPDDLWWVTKTVYTTSDCSGSPFDTDTWSENDASPGEQGYFKCDGNNNYAAIQISVDPQCTVYTNIIGGLGGCSSNPDIYDTKFYCDSSSALVQLYINPTVLGVNTTMCDDNELYCDKWTFPASGCTFVTKFLNTQDVYGSMTKCALSESGNAGSDSSDGDGGDGDGGDGDDSDSSASSQFTLLSIVVALVVGLLNN